MKKRSKSAHRLFKASLATTVATGALVAAVPAFAVAATPTETLVLKDLDKKAYYYADVMNLVERGIINGFPNETYKPGQAVTRGQAAKIIANVLGLDVVNVTNPNFTDVKVTDEFYGPIAALAKEGVINGYPNKAFGQADTLTRAQMAKIITVGFGFKEEALTDNRFTDIKTNAFYAPYLQALLTNKVTTGTTSTTFSPAMDVTRGQIASFVIRAENAVGNEVLKGTFKAQIDAVDQLAGDDADIKMTGNDFTVSVKDPASTIGSFEADTKKIFGDDEGNLKVATAEIILTIAGADVKLNPVLTGNETFDDIIELALNRFKLEDSTPLLALAGVSASFKITGTINTQPFADTYTVTFK